MRCGGVLFATAMAVLSTGCGRLSYDGASASLERDAGDPGMDAAPLDAGASDAMPRDTAGPVGDSGGSDGGTEPSDAGPPDSGPPDSGPPDSGPSDSGPPDSGPPDSGPPDAGPSCPPDMLLVIDGAAFCIEINDRPAEPFDTAATTCAGAGRRLCADDEWRVGCEMGGSGFMDVGDDWEWVDVILSPGVAKKRGYNCVDVSSHAVVDPYPYRCCMTP